MAQTTHASTEVAHGEEAGHKGAFPPFDPSTFASQIFWIAITFLVFYVLMSKLALPRISGILETRRDRIARDMAEAQKLKSETDAAVAAYEHSLAEARKKAQAIAAETRASLNAAVDAKRHAAEAGLAQKTVEAEASIAGIKASAMAEVGGIATEVADSLVSTLTGSAASQQQISDAVAGVLAKVG